MSSHSDEELNGSVKDFNEHVPDLSDFLDPNIEKNIDALKKLVGFNANPTWVSITDDENSETSIKILSVDPSKAGAVLDVTPKFKPKLSEAWKKSFGQNDDNQELFTELQEEILGPMSVLHDVYVLNAARKNEVEYRQLYALHAINHVQKIRDRILHHNQSNAIATAAGQSVDEDMMRDQGFTRPRVLILSPFRNVAKDVVDIMSTLWEMTGNIDGKKRFEEEYGIWRDEDDDLDEELLGDKADPTKPADFNHTFRGNIDDCFRFGLKFTRKSIKLFSEFYSSDIIMASPLGLRLVIDGEKVVVKGQGKDGKGRGKKRSRVGDSDFLSSIDIVVIDGADSMEMQNWEHLEYVLEHLNSIPQDPHGCDFSRVQTIYLDGIAKYFRQTICISQYPFPELNALLRNKALVDNRLGRWEISKNVHSASVIKKSLTFIIPKFYKCPSTGSPVNQAQERLHYFTSQILPKYVREDHVCIFVSSYFDFVQLKQHFSSDSTMSFTCLSEYDESKAITGARSRFFNGHARFLLVTERFYFFRRPQIRGIKHLVFYSLPEHPIFFREWAEFVGDIHKRKSVQAEPERASKTECPVIFSPFDYLKLERIIGTPKTIELLN